MLASAVYCLTDKECRPNHDWVNTVLVMHSVQ